MKELDPDNPLANNTVQRLTPVVEERREKMKDEMLGEALQRRLLLYPLFAQQRVTLVSHACCWAAGKLKDLGNTVLGKFGMSLDNFKMDKDPNTGSYSINFKQ